MAHQSLSNCRALKIEYLATSVLVPDPANVRKHSPKQIAKLASVIREFGFANPILVDEANRIIAGHARREAALVVPLELVPCVRIEGLTPPQKKHWRSPTTS